METNMGVHKLILLAVVLVCFCSRASFAQVNKNLVPGNTNEKTGGNKIDENDSAIGGGTNKVNQSKYTTALARGGSGVQPTGDGRNGNGGQSTSSPHEGGNGVVPVYAAGAGGQLRNHNKGGASTYTSCLKTRFITTALASLLLGILM